MLVADHRGEQLSAIGHAQLAEDAAEMVLDGFDTDNKLVGYLLVGQATGDQADDPLLPCGEARLPRSRG